MRLYKKEGNSIQILSSPKDDIEKGDYLIVEDAMVNRKLITQVIELRSNSEMIASFALRRDPSSTNR